MSRKKNQINFFTPLILLLFSFLSHADELSVQLSNGRCIVTVISPIANGLIEAQIKQQCPGAKGLYVTGLGMQLISTRYCTLLPNLTQITVTRTSAEQFDEDFKENECAFLKKLLFFYNKLTKLPRNVFPALKNLETLKLLRNRLDNLDSNVFMGLEKLTTLDLSHNQFTQLPADLFKPLINLEYLNLDGNHLRTLDLNSIATNAKLKNVYCNECELTTILPTETALKLGIVELRSNKLTDITVLNGLMSLETLELANNVNLTMDGVEFGFLTNLKVLDLGNVSLSTNLNFRKIFPSSLSRLYIYQNFLGTFDLNQLSHLVDLDYLNIVATGLKTLNVEKIRTLFPKMEEIDMKENTFSQDHSEALKEICSSISIICNI